MASTTSCCTGRSSPVNDWIPGRRSRRCGPLGQAPTSWCTSNSPMPRGASPSSNGGRWCCSACTGVADLGSMPADHRFPEDARAHPLGSVSQHIDKDVAHRYAEVSGDWAAHHFDIEVARAAGFDFVFTHGLCTMAICTHRLLGLLGVDDPGRVARVAVRFASPTPLDSELTVNAYGIRPEFVRIRGGRQRHDNHHPRKIGIAAMTKPEIGVYLPQMGFTYDQTPAPHAALRAPRHRLAVALRPPLRARSARLSLAGSLDPGHRAAQPHRAHPGSDIWCCATNFVTPRCWPRWPPRSTRSRRVGFNSASAAARSKTSTTASAWTGAHSASDPHGSGETLEILQQAFANERNRFHRQALHRPGHAHQAGAGPAAPAAHHRRWGRREVHAAAGGAICRCMERAHVCAR